MENKTYEFHLYLKFPPKMAKLFFTFLGVNWDMQPGSYYMEVNEDETGSFDKAYNARKEDKGDVIV